nr:hypothetical protein [Aeromonas veronii]
MACELAAQLLGLTVVGFDLIHAFLLVCQLAQLGSLGVEGGIGGGQIRFEAALCFAQVARLDAGLAHLFAQLAVTGDHFPLFGLELVEGAFGLVELVDHQAGWLGGVGNLALQVVEGAFGLFELGLGDSDLGAQFFIAVNLRALALQIADFGLGVCEVFGGNAALAGDGLEGGGEFVHRPEQDL